MQFQFAHISNHSNSKTPNMDMEMQITGFVCLISHLSMFDCWLESARISEIESQTK